MWVAKWYKQYRHNLRNLHSTLSLTTTYFPFPSDPRKKIIHAGSYGGGSNIKNESVQTMEGKAVLGDRYLLVWLAYWLAKTLSFLNIIIATFSLICFLLSSMGKCTSSVDPYDHYYICRSFYVDINFQSLGSICMLHPKHVIILINLLWK